MNILVYHYVYYTIEMNEKIRKIEDRKDLRHIHWLKENFPSLRKYGITFKESPL